MNYSMSRREKNKPDLATLLALYTQFSPERDVVAQIDRAKLAEVMGTQQFAQQRGFPSMGAMRLAEADEDRDARIGLMSDSRKQAELSNALQNAMTGGRFDVIEKLIASAYPEWGPAPQPEPRKKK